MAQLLVQAWRGETLLAEERHSTPRLARHTAKQWQQNGLTARVLWPGIRNAGRDHVEVYSPDGSMRSGTFAETVRVWGQAS